MLVGATVISWITESIEHFGLAWRELRRHGLAPLLQRVAAWRNTRDVITSSIHAQASAIFGKAMFVCAVVGAWVSETIKDILGQTTRLGGLGHVSRPSTQCQPGYSDRSSAWAVKVVSRW